MFSTSNQGSRQSSTAGSGQASHRTSNLWAAASLSGPQSAACNTSSTLPDFNGHRQNSKPVQTADGAHPSGGGGPGQEATLGMTVASKLQGNSVSPCELRRIRPRALAHEYTYSSVSKSLIWSALACSICLLGDHHTLCNLINPCGQYRDDDALARWANVRWRGVRGDRIAAHSPTSEGFRNTINKGRALQ